MFCETAKTASKPLERSHHVGFDKLIDQIAEGRRDDDALSSLAGRLAALDQKIEDCDRRRIAEAAGGRSLRDLANALLDAVDADVLAREREILADQARGSGKPEDIVQKMVEGRLRKYYEEVALSEQTFVIDGETKVAKVIAAAAEEISADIAVTGFVRCALGEGIEKKEEDFAAEVAATLQG